MSINSINHNTSFKGYIKLPIDNRTIGELDANKILKIETRHNGEETLIHYDFYKNVHHNGYTYREPSVYTVDYDINTILNAYNAAKYSDLTVDLSEYKVH